MFKFIKDIQIRIFFHPLSISIYPFSFALSNHLSSGTMKNWTILLPYYNEATFLTGTLESIAQQNYKQFRLILINNASTDDSEAIVRRVMKKFPDIEVEYLFEAKPGKTLALQKGLAQVKTPYVATMDADTYYPPNYLGFCNYIFEHYPDYIAVMACDIYKPHHDFKSQKRCRKIYRKSRLFSKQCHTGGFGQAFRTESLNRVKGFDQEHWPYVLEDHEIVHRLLKIGKVYYSPKHWCMPSSRCRTNGSK